MVFCNCAVSIWDSAIVCPTLLGLQWIPPLRKPHWRRKRFLPRIGETDLRLILPE